ncbi:hypothetical protein J5N97_026511 [Dioscorea zingiberensis]|uniref:Pentatricopeptide repeat-containing protein n=1 Tax=Dioscorea zingiberensis TaxID=325984 RepID=A0A9D5H6R7_9LILI|nr:hypothetical protein J5N97_026511 [Dioscorea zingiberensis]
MYARFPLKPRNSSSAFRRRTSSSTTLPSIPSSSPRPQTLIPRLRNAAIDLISSRLKQAHHHPIAFLSEHEEAALLPHLRPDDISGILLRSQSLPLPSFRFFRWAMSHPLIHPISPLSHSILAHILTSFRLFSLALLTLSDLVRAHPRHDVFASLVTSSSSCNSNPAVFGMLIKVYIRSGMLHAALNACQRALAIGIVLNANAFNSVLHALVKRNHLDQCWEVYEQMRGAGVSPNAYTFNIMTHALCRGGGASRAWDFLEEMESHGFDPDVVTYNTLIDGYCKVGKTDDALHLFDVMRKRGVEPDLISCTILVRGLCLEGRTKKARQLFDGMLQRGLAPDCIAFNALIAGHCMQGKIRESRVLLQEMVGQGVLPDGFTCSVLVEGYVKCGKLPSCLNLIVQLRSLGVVVPLDVYRHLVGVLCKEERPNAARQLLKWMSEDGHGPDLEIYNMMFHAFCKCNLIRDALNMKDEMGAMKPNLDTYQALICCLCRLSKSAEGEQLMMEMEGSGVVPDSVICAALVDGYCKERNFYKAESIIGYFVLKFKILDQKSFNTLLSAYSNVTDTFKLQERMLKLGFIPDKETCKHLIVKLSQNLDE